MGYRVITYSIVGLALMLTNCIRLVNNIPLDSTWQLDEKTHQEIVHHCVDIEFLETPATFTLKRIDDALILQFNGQCHIWKASANKSYFFARQVLKSSAAGRFCGFQTEISIHFRLAGRNPEKIKGTWQATTCDYCPKVEFIAYKMNNKSNHN